MHHPLTILFRRPMRAAGRAAAGCAAVALAAGCAHHRPATTPTTTSSAGDVATSASSATASHWVAKLNAVGSPTSEVRGRADITPSPTGHSATVVLLLTGLQAGTTYVWHIRRGPCAASEAAGPASEYAPLTVDQQGRATSAGTFPMTGPGLSAFHIDVHPVGAPAVACGDLAAG